MPLPISPYSTVDDTQTYVIRKDLSGGVNTRQHEQIIGENQATILYNVDLSVPGERSIRPGLTLIEDVSNAVGTSCFGFEIGGGSNELLITEGTNLRGWAGSGAFTTHKTDFTTGLITTIIKAGESGEGDVALISNGTDDVFRMVSAHTFQDLGNTNTSPPLSTAMTYYRNRVWILKNNGLYYSDAYPADYSLAFNQTTNYFYMPLGTEMAVIGVRDMGLVCFGQDSVWSINPLATPAATDKPDRLFDIGCIVGKTVCQSGDDIYYLAADGVRALFRNIQDKIQAGVSYPISYQLKTEFDNINWAYISKASAIVWDNKYFLTLPTGASTTNNQVWVYYPALKAWMIITGWNIAYFAKMKVSGQERLYGIDSTDGKIYRCWSGTSDNGTAIAYQEEGRGEDFQKPLQFKVGQDVKVRVKGGSGTVVVSIDLDGEGYQQLGTIDLALTGVSFPLTFPVTFSPLNEATEQWHIDNLEKFKRCKLKIYCNTLNAALTIIESIITANVEEYYPED